jgi:hypothetical protein
MRLLDTEIRWELSNTTSTYMPLGGCSCLPLPILAKRTLQGEAKRGFYLYAIKKDSADLHATKKVARTCVPSA